MSDTYHWQCDFCGATGEKDSRKKRNRARRDHYMKQHPGMGNYGKQRATDGICGDACVQFTGKKICLSGNVIHPGQKRSCWTKEYVDGLR